MLEKAFLFPSFDALGIPRPRSHLYWLRAAVATALQLPQNSPTGNKVFGTPLCSFFDVPMNCDARLKYVRSAVSVLQQQHGHFFRPLYKVDVTVLEEADRRLRVDVEGRVRDGAVVDWHFEFSLPPT